ncbi:MAG: glycosyltransferase family 2 protein [Bacteroidales bacterium]|nr:glycosyltransferase family 2 protein [Bacteroidales bacterium]
MINYSIIIPHRNTPELLRECISSIPNREDLQIIIVDDNSDSSIVDFNNFPGVLRKNMDIVYSKRGKGAGAARNEGLKLVKGRWVLFADADDTYTNVFNCFLDDYIENPADVLYFKSNVVNVDVKNKKPHSRLNYYIDQYLSNKGNIDDVKYGAWEPWNKMIKMDLIRHNNLSFDEIPKANDKMFSLRVGECAKITCVSDICVYNYHLRKGSVINSAQTQDKIEASISSCINQNILYKRVGYKRKAFIPYIFIMNVGKYRGCIVKSYIKYLYHYRANPFEGFFSGFLYAFYIFRMNHR